LGDGWGGVSDRLGGIGARKYYEYHIRWPLVIVVKRIDRSIQYDQRHSYLHFNLASPWGRCFSFCTEQYRSAATVKACARSMGKLNSILEEYRARKCLLTAIALKNIYQLAEIKFGAFNHLS
jgi:hypothetical protein